MPRFDRLRRRKAADPLSELGRALETEEREEELRRGTRTRERAAGIGAAGLRLLGGLAIVALALLVVSTAMLWRIADQTSSTGNEGGSQAAEPPPLPPRSGGSSTRAVAKEFERVTERFGVELRSLNGQLAALGEAAGVDPSLEEQFSGSAQNLELLTTQARGFRGAEDSLARVARSTRRLRAVQSSLASMSRDISTLDTVAANTGAMKASIDSMNGQLGTLSSLDSRMQSMNGSLAALNPMNASLASMNQAMADMNAGIQRMSAAMDVMCTFFEQGGDDECPE